MAVPNVPRITRLRYIRSRDPDLIIGAVNRLGSRIQIYSLNFAQGKWYVWFVPPDNVNIDIPTRDLD